MRNIEKYQESKNFSKPDFTLLPNQSTTFKNDFLEDIIFFEKLEQSFLSSKK